MLNFNSILIFSENPQVLADFYQSVFQVDPNKQGEDWFDISVGFCSIAIGPHDKVSGKNTQPERIMFNLETSEVKDEFERIKDLGATVVKEPYTMEGYPEMWIATFADPDNNYFQLMSPFNESV